MLNLFYLSFMGAAMLVSKKVLVTSIIMSMFAMDSMAAIEINGDLQYGDVEYEPGVRNPTLPSDLAENEVRIKGGTVNIETANTNIKGNTTIGTVTDNKTLEVNGESKLKGNTTVTGDTTLNGATKLNGATSLNGTTALNGNTSITGETTITGETNIIGDSSVSGTLRSTNAVVNGVNVSNRFDEINTRLDNAEAEIINTNTRVTQLNSRVDDVEKTSYRGIAIALAAQQQVPNIGAGQFAVFGGVGHYEGETAGALGVANVFADGRTALSAAVGVAGGNAVGGRIGVSYVFGGK